MGVKHHRESKLPHLPLRGKAQAYQFRRRSVATSSPKAKQNLPWSWQKTFISAAVGRNRKPCLVDAYAARVRSLWETGLKDEAKALLELGTQRYSCAAARLADVEVLVRAADGNLEALLRPLSDPAVPQEIRRAIENAVRRQLYDLSALAECAALTADHPLRISAAALVRAFAAVTAGPVEEAALLLPEVSHRGPLASWKILVRAIAYFTGKTTRTANTASRSSIPIPLRHDSFRPCEPCFVREPTSAWYLLRSHWSPRCVETKCPC